MWCTWRCFSPTQMFFSIVGNKSEILSLIYGLNSRGKGFGIIFNFLYINIYWRKYDYLTYFYEWKFSLRVNSMQCIYMNDDKSGYFVTVNEYSNTINNLIKQKRCHASLFVKHTYIDNHYFLMLSLRKLLYGLQNLTTRNIL